MLASHGAMGWEIIGNTGHFGLGFGNRGVVGNWAQAGRASRLRGGQQAGNELFGFGFGNWDSSYFSYHGVGGDGKGMGKGEKSDLF